MEYIAIFSVIVTLATTGIAVYLWMYPPGREGADDGQEKLYESRQHGKAT